MTVTVTGEPFVNETEVLANEQKIRAHRSHILDTLPPCPPWIVERRFTTTDTSLVVSDLLDRAHPDNPHVKAGHVSRIGDKPAWLEVHVPWDKACEIFGKEPVREIRFTMFKYIIQRPVN